MALCNRLAAFEALHEKVKKMKLQEGLKPSSQLAHMEAVLG
jgi:hypothetical protein